MCITLEHFQCQYYLNIFTKSVYLKFVAYWHNLAKFKVLAFAYIYG